MANPTPPRPAATDERHIEEQLRAFLFRLIQAVDRWNVALGLAILIVFPLGIILMAHYAFDWGFWQTVLYGGLIWLGLMIALVVLSIRDENAKLRRAAADFDLAYPPDTPARETALGILRELESPSRTERKLLNVIMGGTPDAAPDSRFIVRRRSGSAEEELARGLGDLVAPAAPDALSGPPPAPPPPTAPPVEPFPSSGPPPPPPAGAAARKSSDSFDFIPLEPFTPPGPAEAGAPESQGRPGQTTGRKP